MRNAGVCVGCSNICRSYTFTMPPPQIPVVPHRRSGSGIVLNHAATISTSPPDAPNRKPPTLRDRSLRLLLVSINSLVTNLSDSSIGCARVGIVQRGEVCNNGACSASCSFTIVRRIRGENRTSDRLLMSGRDSPNEDGVVARRHAP